MSDASEVLFTLYEAVNGVAGARSPVDAVFGLRIKEGVRCAHCGRVTHQQVSQGPSRQQADLGSDAQCDL